MDDAKHATEIASSIAHPRPVLATLVGDSDSFAESCWSFRPVVFHSLGSFRDLLSGAAISDMLERTLRRPHFRMVRDGSTLPAQDYTRSVRIGGVMTDDVADVERIGREFAAGATLVLQSLERIHPPLSEFARALEAEISHLVQTNAYLSPPGASALARHSDRHDVFVVQLEGSKSWDVEGLGPLELVEGDVLYIPRGCAHSAATNSRHSLHLTIGVLSVTYAAVIRRAVESLEHGFDRALPLGFAAPSEHMELAAEIGDAISSATTQLRSRDLLEIARSEQDRVRRHVGGSGGIRRELALLELTGETRLSARPDATVTTVDDSVVIAFGGGRELRMPVAAAPALEALTASETVAIDDLVGLDAASRLVLARRLLREGAADLVSDATSTHDGA